MELFFPDFSFHDKSLLSLSHGHVLDGCDHCHNDDKDRRQGSRRAVLLFRKPSLYDHLGHCIVGITRTALGKRIRKS